MPQLLETERARAAGTALATIRIAIGVAAMAAPGLVLRPWVGAVAPEDAGGRLLGRSIGVRDVALGVGAVLAGRHGAPQRGWIEAGALSDTGDFVATLIAFPSLAKPTRWGVLAMTAGAIVAGGIVAPCVDAS